jgi:phosphoribosylglycinamide formyltransferase-1
MLKAKIALFASGQGSNALNIIQHFESHPSIDVQFVLSNKQDAQVIEAANNRGVQTFCFSNAEVEDGGFMTQFCNEQAIDYIILAGFLRKIPQQLIQAFPARIINIHPALLPKFGGSGMYGKHVHMAVLANREVETGITIHYVDEAFDSGKKIAQFYCEVLPSDTVESVQQKVQKLEQNYFPMVLEKTILTQGHV